MNVLIIDKKDKRQITLGLIEVLDFLIMIDHQNKTFIYLKDTSGIHETIDVYPISVLNDHLCKLGVFV